MEKGIVFNIQRCSIHDGPGIRTTIFLKGCNLRCKWCSNPESQKRNPEIMSFYTKCIGCGNCIKSCTQNAISLINGSMIINPKKCNNCGLCTEVCFSESKIIMGDIIDTETLFNEVEKDYSFYEKSSGGITVSGGEPLLQADFLIEFLEKCRKANIHSAIETCGFAKYESFSSVKNLLNLLIIDIKHADSKKHEELTGVGNELILENLRRMDEWGIPIIIRTPIIPFCNDSKDDIAAIAKICNTLNNIKEYELIAYHRLGQSKYLSLSREYELQCLKPPSVVLMDTLVNTANQVLKNCNKKCVYKK